MSAFEGSGLIVVGPEVYKCFYGLLVRGWFQDRRKHKHFINRLKRKIPKFIGFRHSINRDVMEVLWRSGAGFVTGLEQMSGLSPRKLADAAISRFQET